MDKGFSLFPYQASRLAGAIDTLYLALWALTIFFTALIFVLITFFALRYRRKSEDEAPPPVFESLKLELFYTVFPFFIVMGIFVWSSALFFQIYKKPVDPINIHVVGKQWMWKIQHPEGPREINALHVPVGRPVQVTLSSQDVIHSFYLPAMRVKMDAVPGRYTSMSFEPTRVGQYHIFCAEYCGTQHSGMIGAITVMEPADYEAWLAGTMPGEAPVAGGARLFRELGCAACHGVQAPSLAGVFGSKVEYVDYPGGPVKTTTADENYLRESILHSTAKIVANYQPIMPSFSGQISEEQVVQLIEYIKSLQNSADSPASVRMGGMPDRGGSAAESLQGR